MGGVVINGHGELNTYDGDDAAEGIADPSGQGRDVFGAADLDGNGTNEFFDSAESSGTLRYVSIRHGGSEMPNPPVNFANVINGDETNGLSLNGVGSGTTIEHVEIVSTLDDGLQIGRIRQPQALLWPSLPKKTSSMTWMERGHAVFSLMDQPDMVGEHGFDLEGDDFEFQDVTLSFLPYTNPQIANFTSIGHSELTAVRWHNGGGGRLYNGIFQNWGFGIDFEDHDPCDAYELFLFGELEIHNNRFWNVETASRWIP